MRSQLSEMPPMTKPQTGSPENTQHGTPVNSSNGYVLGVDIGGTNLRLALADMDGRIVARTSASTVESRNANVVIERIQSGAEELLKQVSASKESLRAVAAGAPGVTDVDAGVVLATSYLMGWRDVPFRSLLESALGVPAVVDNDVNLAAIGESWAGSAKGTRDFVFIAIGTGIGAGIILNGKSFRGMGWAAGEIGYMLVPGVPDDPVDHGKPGSLESLIGGQGIKTQWQQVWNESATKLPKDLAATDVFDGATAGDKVAQGILDQSARLLAYAIYNTSLVLNCPLFVLGGGVGMHPAFSDATRHALQQWSERGAQLQLIRSELGAEAQLMGAIRLALDLATSQSSVS